MRNSAEAYAVYKSEVMLCKYEVDKVTFWLDDVYSDKMTSIEIERHVKYMSDLLDKKVRIVKNKGK